MRHQPLSQCISALPNWESESWHPAAVASPSPLPSFSFSSTALILSTHTTTRNHAQYNMKTSPASRGSLTSVVAVFLFFLSFIQFSSALKFDLPSYRGNAATKHQRCIRNYVSENQLVVVTAHVSGQKGDGQVVNMHVCCWGYIYISGHLHTKPP